jgi:integrase
LGNIAVDKLTPALVIEVLNPIAAKGNAETVRRLCQRINEILDFAVNTGRLQINTLSKINSAFIAPTKKNLPALKPEELPVFLNTLQKASIKLVTRALIEWQLNTMVRPSEAAMTEWQEIDYDNKLWVIPAHKMKKKSNGDHSVPLTKQTLALLEMMKPISGYAQHIFPADRDPKTHVNSQTANMAIKRMGYKDKLVSHGMRSIASTVLNEEGFDYDVIEASLAHVDKNTVRRAYNRTDYLERRRVLMQWWSDYIENASRGSCTLAST